MSWYSEWFGEEYLLLYAHRDGAEARNQVEFLCDRLLSSEPAKILDIACGQGRHLLEFTRRSHNAIGIDLSPALLRRASKLTKEPLPLIRADMRRLPFASGCFDLLSSFFTSFGYFETDEDHLMLLKEWRRVSRDGGLLFLDYLNAAQVARTLEPESIIENDQHSVAQFRRLSSDGKRVEKDILITCKESGREATFTESVRMFRLGELNVLMADAGYDVVETLGDYDGSAYGEESPRLLLTAKASPQANAAIGS